MWKRPGFTKSSLTVQPASEAPKFALTRNPETTVSTVSYRRAPKFRITDRRQDFEKQYYPGNTSPHHWRDAMTILPMESFRPEFDDALERAIIDNISNAGSVASVEVAIGSFHVALDERERGENELLSGYKKWDDQREQSEAEREARKQRDDELEREARRRNAALGLSEHDDDDDSVGSAIVGAIFKSTVVKPIKRARLQKAKSEQLSAAPQTLPQSLTAGKQPGWNCRLTTVVNLVSESGATQTVPISVMAAVPKDNAFSVEEQIQAVVTSTLDKFGTELRRATANP